MFFFKPKLIVVGAAAYVSTKKAQRNTKKVWTATATVVQGRHHMPINNLCISTNVKYEGGRVVGENILDKTTRKGYGGGTGALQGY